MNQISPDAPRSVDEKPLPPAERCVVLPSVVSRYLDFWLLGGTSIALWAVMVVGQCFRQSSEAVESHFVQVSAAFSLLTLVCNHPHFISSYRLGYGRGISFIFRHAGSLIAVPVSLLSFYLVAYFNYHAQMREWSSVIFLNQCFAGAGLEFRLGTLADFGTETLSFSVLFMNLTVGWHYAKQVFGCTMVYAHYDRYPITFSQRRWIKASLFSVAFFNFFYFSIGASRYHAGISSPFYFFNIPLVELGLSAVLIPISVFTVMICGAGVVYGIVWKNYRRLGIKPSANLLVPWVAFHVWWIPLFRQMDFYVAAIPFFHALQYLPFIYRLENAKLKAGKWLYLNRTLRLAGLFFVGFCAFELIPSLLDQRFETMWYLRTWFFMVTFAVFINVHHFFIDSVVWKFNQQEVRAGIL